jgi:hypothetical protein
MDPIPRLKKPADRRTINICVDKVTYDLYCLAKQNGYNNSEIVRRAVSDELIKLAAQIKLPAK